MKRLFFYFSCFLYAQEAVVDVSHLAVFETIASTSHLETEIIYGMKLQILSEEGDGYHVLLTDGSKGFVREKKALSFQIPLSTIRTKSLFTHVYPEDNPFAPPLTTLPFGSFVEMLEAPHDRWVPVQLQGMKGFIHRNDLEFESHLLSTNEMLLLAKRFLGLPYTWGGTSSFGLDCSGFVQMLFKERGILLPRNSRDQASSPLLKEVSFAHLLPGDLLFFGEKRITHVGIYLGEREFIHSGMHDQGPGVQISHLDHTSYHLLKAARYDPS